MLTGPKSRFPRAGKIKLEKALEVRELPLYAALLPTDLIRELDTRGLFSYSEKSDNTMFGTIVSRETAIHKHLANLKKEGETEGFLFDHLKELCLIF